MTSLDTLTFLSAALDVEAELLASGAYAGVETERICPVKHSFGAGCYIREWNSPAGVVTVSKIHKVAHPFFVLKGDVSVLTEAGVERIKAPHYGITPPGTKRVLYTHAPTQWVTVHVTDSTDLTDIEAEIIVSDPNHLIDGDRHELGSSSSRG
jgi:hypothetical protein